MFCSLVIAREHTNDLLRKTQTPTLDLPIAQYSSKAKNFDRRQSYSQEVALSILTGMKLIEAVFWVVIKNTPRLTDHPSYNKKLSQKIRTRFFRSNVWPTIDNQFKLISHLINFVQILLLIIAIEVPSLLASQQRNLEFTVKSTDNQLKLIKLWLISAKSCF